MHQTVQEMCTVEPMSQM